MKRASFAVLLLALLGVAACGDEEEIPKSSPAHERVQDQQGAYKLAGLRDKLATRAIEAAREVDVSLDFSVESVKRVEAVLGQLHQEYRETGDAERLHSLAHGFGAYLIKVIESNFDRGAWQQDHETLGEGTWPYRWRDSTIFPVAWCGKRIFDGPADDVWTKFKHFVLGDE